MQVFRSNSVEAEALKKTLQECEESASVGESRYCATSLASMVDFSTSQLKTRSILAISTEISKEETPMQHYTITRSQGRERGRDWWDWWERERLMRLMGERGLLVFFKIHQFLQCQYLSFCNYYFFSMWLILQTLNASIHVECFNSTHNRINCSWN